MAGLSVNLSGVEIQRVFGMIAMDVHWGFERAVAAKEFLDANDNATLQSLYGISSADADAMRAAFADVQQLRAIYRGNQTLTTAKDFRTTVSKLYGLGFNPQPR